MPEAYIVRPRALIISFIKRPEHFLNQNIIFLLRKAKPVSYTHLDVYKRQIMGRLAESLLPPHPKTVIILPL